MGCGASAPAAVAVDGAATPLASKEETPTTASPMDAPAPTPDPPIPPSEEPGVEDVTAAADVPAAAVVATLTETQIANLRISFEAMDANRDGTLTREELKAMLGGLGENVDDAVVDEMMKKADEDQDGKVNFEEFAKAATAEGTAGLDEAPDDDDE